MPGQRIDITERLKTLIADISKKQDKTLLKEVRELDKLMSDWLEGYKAIYSKVPDDSLVITDEMAGEMNYHLPGDSSLEAMIRHVKKFESFTATKMVEQLLEDIRPLYHEEEPEKLTRFSRVLEKEFWDTPSDDESGHKTRKRIQRQNLKVAGMFRKKEHPWGVQSFYEEYLFIHYFAAPAVRKLQKLMNQRLQEYARLIHNIHNEDEAELVRYIMKVIHPAVQGEQAAGQEEAPEKENTGISPIKTLTDQLKAWRSEQETRLVDVMNLAGTPLMPESQFSTERIGNELSQIRKLAERTADKWEGYFAGESDDWVKDLEIILLQVRALKIAGNAEAQLTSKLLKGVIPSVESSSKLIRESFEKIRNNESKSDELRDRILSESRHGLRKFRQERIPMLIDDLTKAQLLKTVDNFRLQIRYRLNSLQDEYPILQKLNLEVTPPEVSVKQISLKTIIDTDLSDTLRGDFQEFLEEAEEEQNEILRTLNEIGYMIEFNLESALEVMDKEEGESEDAGKIVTDGLDRAYHVIEQVESRIREIPRKWGKRIHVLAIEFVQGIDKLSDNQNIMNLMVLQARAEASIRIREYRKAMAAKVTMALRKVWRLVSFGLTEARTGYHQISKMTGMAGVSEAERELMNELFTTRAKISGLPFIYQRIYRFEALREDSMFAGRTSEMEQLAHNYELWRTGKFANVAIIGEKGSGRTTLINMATRTIAKSAKLIEIKIAKGTFDEAALLTAMKGLAGQEPPSTLKELEKQLLGQERKVIAVVEDIQNMFIRTINGFELLEKFMLLISKTHSKVFWIVSGGVYLWNYLDRVITISRYFNEVISLDQLDADETRDIILKRHRMSGYALEYKPSETDLADRRYKKLTTEKERQQFLETEFFRDLQVLTKGNISVAFLIWQLAVDEIKSDRIIIKNAFYPETSFLKELPEDEVFTLEAIAEFERLTVGEHATIFRTELQYSELLLNRMRNKGILFETNGEFQIHFLLYKQILRVLDERNILK